MAVDPSLAGRTFPPTEPYEVSREKILEFARATGSVYDGEAAITLRAIETGAREVHKALPDGGSTAYLDLVRRLLQANSVEQRAAEEAKPESRLILP